MHDKKGLATHSTRIFHIFTLIAGATLSVVGLYLAFEGGTGVGAYIGILGLLGVGTSLFAIFRAEKVADNQPRIHPYLLSGLGFAVIGAVVLVVAIASLAGAFPDNAPHDFYSWLGVVGGLGALGLGVMTLRAWKQTRKR